MKFLTFVALAAAQESWADEAAMTTWLEDELNYGVDLIEESTDFVVADDGTTTSITAEAGTALPVSMMLDEDFNWAGASTFTEDAANSDVALTLLDLGSVAVADSSAATDGTEFTGYVAVGTPSAAVAGDVFTSTWTVS